METLESLLRRAQEAPLTFDDAMQLATALHRAGDIEPAEQMYRRLLKAAPDHPDVLHYLGLLRNDHGDTHEAMQLVSRSVDLAPGFAPFHSNLGNLLLEQERFDEAEAAYQQALALDPEQPGTLNNHGVLCKALGRDAEAEQSLLRAIDLAPGFIDARVTLARLYMRQGRVLEAMEQNAEAVKHRPQDARTRELQGYIYTRLGRLEDAAAVYREWIADEPDNPKPQHQLAACTGESVPERASDAYVQFVFDKFSASFDARLSKLEYRAPALVTDAVAAELGSPAASLDILDAGCGTGLCAPLLRPFAAQLDGVDLSAGMLDKARRRDLYDDLSQAELTNYMDTHPARYDLVVSADTLVYFGALGDALAAADRTLRPGGLLCFTAESLDEAVAAEYRLQHHGRYAHSRAYLERALHGAGFDLLRLDPEWLRMEAGEQVQGWLVLARRSAGTDAS